MHSKCLLSEGSPNISNLKLNTFTLDPLHPICSLIKYSTSTHLICVWGMGQGHHVDHIRAESMLGA